MPRTSLAITPPWNEQRARTFLDAAHAKMAAGTGMSDRTFERMAALADPEASTSRARFETALQRAGWTQGRIRRALAEVKGRDRRLVLRFPTLSARDLMFVALGATFCGALGGAGSALGFVVGWLILRAFRLIP